MNDTTQNCVEKLIAPYISLLKIQRMPFCPAAQGYCHFEPLDLHPMNESMNPGHSARTNKKKLVQNKKPKNKKKVFLKPPKKKEDPKTGC
jgi:hypothetical protein